MKRLKSLRVKHILTGFIAVALIAGSIGIATAEDFGLAISQLLFSKSQKLFGFNKPLPSSATTADVVPRELASASQRQLLAGSLGAEFVARNVANLADMIAFWPNDINYTHLIVCIEQGRSGTTPGGNSGQNPSVQRVDLATGSVETILFGMERCDPVRTTQWGTILVGEETSDGAVYEILDPINTTGCWIADRGAAGLDADVRLAIDDLTPDSCEGKIKKRTALPTQAWEGVGVLDNGVVIGGDELRPGEDFDGGAVFRFVPAIFYVCQGAPVRPGQVCGNPIDGLDESPLVSGQNYALFHVCDEDDQYGQGCEYGNGRWVEVGAATARDDANDNGATGYCRPEDLQIDRTFGEFVGGDGIRWCWNNTCGGGDDIGEALCVEESSTAIDSNDHVTIDIGGSIGNINFLANGGDLTTAKVTRFAQADDDMNSYDNMDIQPFTNNVYIVEDHSFGDIWACLQDGGDRDFATDGCVKMLSIRDPVAEPTGFIFDGTGDVAYYNIQHGQQPAGLLDFGSNPVNGRTDDLMRITGFNVGSVNNK